MSEPVAEHLILLVDDEVAVRNFYQLHLENNHFKVRPASSASEALRLLDHEAVSLAVIDVYLGQDNGIDLVRRIRTFVPALPIILMSGRPSDDPVFQQALQTGADSVYSKTVPLSELLKDIKRLLARRNDTQP